jgi:magnesium transporter
MYVTSDDWALLGVVSLRTLLVADPTQTLKQIMKPLPRRSTLRPRHKLKEVVRIMTKYDLFTAAVVDKDRHLAGVVTIDDVMRQLAPRA